MAITNFNFPRVTVSQQFTGAGVSTDAALPVCVIGPEYAVKTYAKYGDQLLVGEFGGTYTNIPYPGNTAGNQVNPGSVQLLIKDALIQLFDSTAVANTKFVTAKTAGGTDELNKLVCMRTGAGDTDVEVALCSGNGYTRDAAVATNIVAGDVLLLQGTSYQVAGIERSNGKYAVVVLTKPLPAAVTDAAATIARQADVIATATAATTTTVTCPSTATTSIQNTEGQTVAELPVSGGNLYVQYSTRILTHVNVLGAIAAGSGAVAALADIFDGITNQNPLGQGVAAACTTAGDSLVYFTAVKDDTVAAYAQAMDFLDGRDNCYSCVILSEDPQVIKTCLAYATAQSEAETPNPKIIWAGISNPDAVSLATFQDYIIGEEGDSVTVDDVTALAAVRTGDYIRWQSGTTVFGAPEYTDAQITGIDGATVSFTAPGTLDTMTADISIVRKNYSKLQLVDHIIETKAVTDRRAALVYADGAIFNGEQVPGYIAAACAAGMRAKEQPHRPLSNMTYNSLTVLQAHGLALSSLKTLGANGIWLIGNNAAGTAINRRQVTSAAANDINYDEQSLTTNVDSVIRVVKHVGQDMVGNSNINPTLIASLRNSLQDLLEAFTVYSQSINVGPQLLDAVLISLEQDTVNLDTVYADIQIQPPKPFNRLHIRLRLA